MPSAAYPLALARAERDQAAADLKAHKRSCARCGAKGRGRPGPCPDGARMAAHARETAEQVETWFGPGPEQGMLL